MMQKIDVIMLANNVEDRHYQLSLETINSLRETESDVQFNIIILESNNESTYPFDDCKVIKPGIKFNYAEFVNIGYKECYGEWVLVINNDLHFTPGWFNEVLDVYSGDNTIESFSFYEPDYHGKYFSSMFNDVDDVYEGYDVGPRISGWCILHRRSILDKIKGWDEAFSFYYVDDDYGQLIKSIGIRNVMLKKSIVYHKVSQSHETIPNLVNQKAADLAKNLYEKKWFTEIPLVSFVVPAFSFRDYIVECIDSILSQRVNFEIEILVRDDYSGDDTNNILYERYSGDTRVHIFNSTGNLGPFRNIKFLIERARGKYIAYLDGDDYYTDSSKIQRQIDFLESHPDYILHSTGNLMLHPDKGIMPEDGSWIAPLYPEPGPSELIKSNVVGFGRVFRNVENMVKPWMAGAPYFDWLLNFELSLRGKIYCDSTCTGVYRLSPQGMFSLKSEEEKNKENREITRLLERRMSEEFKNKKITIIDCFIRNESIETKLKASIYEMKSRGEAVMLISNTPADKSVIEMCDFYLYDHRNQLFNEEYTNVEDVDFFSPGDGFVAHNIKPGLQRHGLSVLVNLFNSLHIAKSLGYTHFQRLECDDLFGPRSLDTMDEVERRCTSENKKGLFYFNEDQNDRNVSFHYFFCEIDYFLDKVHRINNESDYIEYLLANHGNRDFVIAERYIYENLKRNGCDEILHKNGKLDMNSDFPDTIWNTETSGSNVSEKYRGCLTELYNKYAGDWSHLGVVIYSSNYSNTLRERKIRVNLDNGEHYYVNQLLTCKGAWTFENAPVNIESIDVYENEELLYSQTSQEIKSYLKWD